MINKDFIAFGHNILNLNKKQRTEVYLKSFSVGIINKITTSQYLRSGRIKFNGNNVIEVERGDFAFPCIIKVSYIKDEGLGLYYYVNCNKTNIFSLNENIVIKEVIENYEMVTQSKSFKNFLNNYWLMQL